MSATIFVDYADGARGELLAYFLNSHVEFNNHEFEDHNMQDLHGLGIKWFNSHSLVSQDWDENFLEYLQAWKKQSSPAKALSYHLYKYPHHVDLLKTHIDHVRFIKINSNGHEDFCKYDYIRKVLFRKLTKQNLEEIKFLIPDIQKIPIIQLLKQDRLRGIDLELARSGQAINTQSRQQFVHEFLAQQVTLPTQDIEISYHNWFLDLSCLPGAYEKLCSELKICADQNKLDKLLMKNEKNLTELESFMDNFNQLMETL